MCKVLNVYCVPHVSPDVVAEERCNTCPVNLCHLCSHAHTRQRRTAHHVVISLQVQTHDSTVNIYFGTDFPVTFFLLIQ